jgi:ketosteroid isomerase-like protein
MTNNSLFAVALFASIAPMASGCFYDSTWGARKTAQKHNAARAEPASLAPAGAPGLAAQAPPEHTLRVRVHATPAYAAQVADWKTHVATVIGEASATMRRSVGVELVLASADAWEAIGGDHLDQTLAALREEDAGEGAELVVGFVGGLPIATQSFEQLGLAQLGGKYLVVRAPNVAAEYDAVAKAFDELSEEERTRLRRERLRHCEVAVLLHEIGHTLRAEHQRAEGSLMRPAYDPKMSAFDPTSVATMRATLDGVGSASRSLDGGDGVAVSSPADATPAATGRPISNEKLHAAIVAYVAAWNAHDPKAIGDFYAPDAIVRNWGGCGGSNRRGIVHSVQDRLTMFPDLATSLRRVFVKGSEVVVEVAVLGTNTGVSPAPASEAPTGKVFGEIGVRIMLFTPDGLIRDERDYFDVVTESAQLHGGGRARSPNAASVPVELYAAGGTPEEQTNVAIAVAMQNAYGAHDLQRYGDALADDVVWDDFMAPATLAGKRLQVDYFRLLAKALPDVVSNCDTWGAGDYVIEECAIVGTDRGRIDSSHAPTGERMAIHRLDVLEVRDGKVRKAWSYGNRDEESRRLGAVFPARGDGAWTKLRSP